MRLAERRGKIIATIGPATCDLVSLEHAIRAGMNVARINFSHGTQVEHQKVIERVRSLSVRLHAPVSILADLQGPKIRVANLPESGVPLRVGDHVWLTGERVNGSASLIPTDYAEFSEACSIGAPIFLDDGLMELRILSVEHPQVEAEILSGGLLKNRKGVSVPGGKISLESLTEKDLADLKFAIQQEVDYVALSFVREGKDIQKLRAILDHHQSKARIVAKIEMLQAIDHLDEIVQLSDVVMVARGDLAVEIGASRLPGIQKKLIRLCNKLKRPVITATQMLDSMVENSRPTRAEITDVANAILDGSDALMLSAETATGKNPFACIATMHDIILEVEKNEEEYYSISLEEEFLNTAETIGASACLSAMKLNASAIVCLTTTGRTASIISSFRPKATLVAVTDDISVLNRMELIWGIQTFLIRAYSQVEEVLVQVDRLLVEHGLAKAGDQIVLTLGQPIQEEAKTNSLYIHTVSGVGYNLLSSDLLPLRYQQLNP